MQKDFIVEGGKPETLTISLVDAAFRMAFRLERRPTVDGRVIAEKHLADLKRIRDRKEQEARTCRGETDAKSSTVSNRKADPLE